MELTQPPATRPAEHLLRAHLAHAEHHELLAEGQPVRMAEAIASVAASPPAAAESSSTPRRRRKK